MAGAAEAIWQYNKAIVDATYDLIPAVKPQIAMYEQFGVEGLKCSYFIAKPVSFHLKFVMLHNDSLLSQILLSNCCQMRSDIMVLDI